MRKVLVLWPVLLAILGALAGLMAGKVFDRSDPAPILRPRTTRSTSEPAAEWSAPEPGKKTVGEFPPPDWGGASRIWEGLRTSGEPANRWYDWTEISEQARHVRRQDTAFFVEQYRRAIDPATREAALILAIAAGGPELMDLFRNALSGGSATDRLDLLSIFASGLNWYPEFLPLRLEDDVAAAAAVILKASDPVLRAGAARILSLHPSGSTESKLRYAARFDLDREVRLAAVDALGWIGEAETMEFLSAMADEETNDAVRSASFRARVQIQEKLRLRSE